MAGAGSGGYLAAGGSSVLGVAAAAASAAAVDVAMAVVMGTMC